MRQQVHLALCHPFGYQYCGDNYSCFIHIRIHSQSSSLLQRMDDVALQ